MEPLALWPAESTEKTLDSATHLQCDPWQFATSLGFRVLIGYMSPPALAQVVTLKAPVW